MSGDVNSNVPPTIPSIPEDVCGKPLCANSHILDAGSRVLQSFAPINSFAEVPISQNPYVAAAENRVSEALHNLVESIEARILEALKQASIDIIHHLGNEAAAHIILSERRAALVDQQHMHTKEQALQLMLRLKQASDHQILEAERKIVVERRRAQDAEARLFTAQETNKRLKAELKRKCEILEEFQKRVQPIDGHEEGMHSGVIEGFESKKRNLKLKGQTAVRLAQPLVKVAPDDAPPTVHACCSSVHETLSAFESDKILACEDGHCSTKFSTAVTLSPDRLNLSVKGAAMNSDCNGSEGFPYEINEMNSLLFQPMDQPVTSCSESFLKDMDYSNLIDYNDLTLTSRKYEQPLACEKVDLEGTSQKDIEDEKSCLTMDGHPIPDLSLLVNEQTVTKSQCERESDNQDALKSHLPDKTSSSEHVTQTVISVNIEEKISLGAFSVARKAEKGTFEVEELAESTHVLDSGGSLELHRRESKSSKQAMEMNRCSPVTDEQVDALSCLESLRTAYDTGVPETKQYGSKTSSCDILAYVECCQELQNESPSSLLRGKRKASTQKYESSLAKDKVKKLEDVNGASESFDQCMSPGGTELHGLCISSRDSRRLMQGARQLFALAERKWR